MIDEIQNGKNIGLCDELFEVVGILAVQNGRITEHWSVVDRLDLFQQLGLIQRG